MGKTAGKAAVLLLTLMLVAAVLAFSGHQRQLDVPPDYEAVTVDYVIDGDTIDVIGPDGEARVRLAGIDAPESAMRDEELNTPEGERATAFTRELLPVGVTVYLQKDVSETDKYGRLVRYVWLEVPQNPRDPDEVAQKMANALIVAAGYAKARPYRPDVAYEAELQAAQDRALAEDAGVSYLWS